MLIGRNRYKTHGGIPHGSTNALAGNLSCYFQWNQDILASQWDDQSTNDNHITQGTAGDQADVEAGALDFERTEADHYDFTSTITVSAEQGWAMWAMVNLEQAGHDNVAIISFGNTQHMVEFFNDENKIRVRLGSTTTLISPGDGTRGDWGAEEKYLLTVSRDAGATGNLHVYKNGVLIAQESQASNSGDGDFNAVGVRANDRYFDGKIYDLGFAKAPTSGQIDRINAYLCAKHGIAQHLV